jgi:hypothetical protein
MSVTKTVGTCHVCGTTDQSKIVYSGVDALILGIPGAETGTSCYSCAKLQSKPVEIVSASNKGLCKNCGTMDDSRIVYSGVDAFMLGLEETGRVCYDCAEAEPANN